MRCFVSKETNICDKTGPIYMKDCNKNPTKERNYTVMISVVKPSNTSVKSTNKFKINRKHSQIHRFFYEKVLLEDLSSIHAQAVSRPEIFCKKRVLKNLTKFTGRHLCQSLFFNKVACNFIKKETLTQVFSCEFCKIFKSTSFYTTPPVAASWQVLKALVIEKKIFAIPPVFENSKCITNFGEKRTIFNSNSNPIVSLAPHLTQRFEKKHLILYFSIDNISNVSPCLDYATNHSK